jgi:D-alanyl-D-alanine carboxypeptidase
MLPRIVGAVVGKKSEPQAGFDLEREWLTKAGLDVGSASQGDGAGASAHYTPDFMVAYLAYMARQKSYPALLRGAAGARPGRHPREDSGDVSRRRQGARKTGTFGEDDLLTRGRMVTAKGLAGYFTRPDGGASRSRSISTMSS